MKIKIYQIEMDRDEKRVKFFGFDRLEKWQGSSKVNSEIYDLVYTSDVDCKNLEDVYQMFNLSHPGDFRGHSLSVSDIVEVSDSKSVENGYYFCDSFGFKKVEFAASKCQISEFYNKKLDDKITEASKQTDSIGKENTDKEIELIE